MEKKKKSIKDQMRGLRAYTDSVANQEKDPKMAMKKAIVLKKLRNSQDSGSTVDKDLMKKKLKKKGY